MADLKLNINGAEVVVPEAQVQEAVTKGELQIKADNLKVMATTDFETLTTNLKNEEYNKGKIVGVEMTVKEQREALGLSFEGKTVSNLLEAYRGKIMADAKIEPSKQIEELQRDKEKLQGSITEWQTKYAGLENTYTQKEKEATKFNSLLSVIPVDGLALSREKVARNIKFDLEEKGFQLDIEEGKTVIKQNGVVVKDSLMNPMSLDKFLPDFVKPYAIERKGGSGGNDNNNNISGLEAFTKEMIDKGIQPSSAKFNEEMSARISNKTLKI